jgi:hypothetical protein
MGLTTFRWGQVYHPVDHLKSLTEYFAEQVTYLQALSRLQTFYLATTRRALTPVRAEGDAGPRVVRDLGPTQF